MKSKGCRKKRISISAYLDGELLPRERVKVEAHLRVCQECSGYLAELRTVCARVKMLPQLEPSQQMVIELKRAVRLLPAVSAVRKKRFAHVFGYSAQPRWAFAAAASVLVAVAILFSVTPLGRQSELASKASGEAGLTASSSGAALADRADSDLARAKERLLAELSWEHASHDAKPDENRGLRPTVASYGREIETRGQVVHSVDFGSSYARRPPVSSHVLYVTYGN